MKKYLSLIAVLALVVACMVPAVFATSIPWAIGSVEVEMGEGTTQVKLPVSTVEMGIAAGDFSGITVTGDAKIVGVESGAIGVGYNPDNGMGYALNMNGVDVTGTLFYIVVEVPTAKPATYTVSIGAATATSIEAELNMAPVTVSAGTITVAHEHVAGEWEVVKEATCTEDGLKVQKCTLCGEVLAEEGIKALGHAWDNGVLPETYDCDDVLKTYTCERCDATKTEDASHKHATAKYVLDVRVAEDGTQYARTQVKCVHGDKENDAYHGCSYEEDIVETPIDPDVPVVGDITPYIAMGVLTMVALVSAAAYMLLKRKAI